MVIRMNKQLFDYVLAQICEYADSNPLFFYDTSMREYEEKMARSMSAKFLHDWCKVPMNKVAEFHEVAFNTIKLAYNNFSYQRYPHTQKFFETLFQELAQVPVLFPLGDPPRQLIPALDVSRISALDLIYIAGKITGNKNAVENFKNAENYLLHFTKYVVNPIEDAKDVEGESWEVIMKHLIQSRVLNADMIVALPDWTDSRGAKVEIALAMELGIPVFSLNI